MILNLNSYVMKLAFDDICVGVISMAVRVAFGDDCFAIAKQKEINLNTNISDELEYDCWELIESYADAFEIKLSNNDGSPGCISFDLAKRVQETILKIFKDSGFTFVFQ